MGMDVGGESGGALSTPNVVPLIDILLVLIIIFMVIAPVIPKGLDTLVPQPSPNQQQNVELENKTVVVQVYQNGKLKINQEDTTWEGLGPRRENCFCQRRQRCTVHGRRARYRRHARRGHRQDRLDHRQTRSRSIVFRSVTLLRWRQWM
jgi:biopolymer transport protein TolR